MIETLIAEVKGLKGCIVLPPTTLPKLQNDKHCFSSDLEIFYKLCGGLTLYIEAEYSISIVPPEEFMLANPVIVGELCEEDISADWYIVGTGGSSEYITIDLSSDKLGKCYDSYAFRHGLAG